MAANDRPLTSILNSSPPRQTDQSLSSHSSATPVVNTASRQTTNSFQLTSGSTSYPVHASYFRPGQSNYQSPYVSQPSHLPPRTSQAADDSPFSEGTAQVIAKINAKVKAKSLAEADHGQSSWQMARDPAVAEMTSQARPTTDVTATPPPPNPNRTGGRRGRGPRRRRSPIATGAITLENASASGFQTPPGRGRGRGFGRGHRSRGGRGSRGGIVRGNGAKSKRTRGEDGEDFEDSDSSETFTPLPPQSRFGRKIFQANSNNPVIKIDDETPAISTVAASTTPVEKGPARKKAGFRRTPGGVTAVCKNCERGHSPASNAIVFCDGCNMPWHQYCHDPPIKDEIVLIAETEWYCSDCGVMKEARARLDGKVAGDGLSLLEKREYFQNLNHNELVSLLLHACLLHPNLPVFASKSAQDDNGVTADAAASEEEYDEDEELPYPKPGNGIRLPPEDDDIHILMDDDTEAFSHHWQGIAEMMSATGNALMGMNHTAMTVGAF